MTSEQKGPLAATQFAKQSTQEGDSIVTGQPADLTLIIGGAQA